MIVQNCELDSICENLFVRHTRNIIEHTTVDLCENEDSKNREIIIRNVEGKSKEEASRYLEEKKIAYITSFDNGRFCQYKYENILINRVNLCVENNIVIRAFFG